MAATLNSHHQARVWGTVLECKACKMNLSPVNPARAQKRHKCPSAALAAAGGSTSKQAMEEDKRSKEEDEVDELGWPAMAFFQEDSAAAVHCIPSPAQAVPPPPGPPLYQRGGALQQAGVPLAKVRPTSAATSASPQPSSWYMSRQTCLLHGYQSRPAQARSKQGRA